MRCACVSAASMRQAVFSGEIVEDGPAVADGVVAVDDVGQLPARRLRGVEDVLVGERHAGELEEGIDLQAIAVVVGDAEQRRIGIEREHVGPRFEFETSQFKMKRAKRKPELARCARHALDRRFRFAARCSGRSMTASADRSRDRRIRPGSRQGNGLVGTLSPRPGRCRCRSLIRWKATWADGPATAAADQHAMLGLPLHRRLAATEIHRAYKRAAMTAHPDVGGNGEVSPVAGGSARCADASAAKSAVAAPALMRRTPIECGETAIGSTGALTASIRGSRACRS